MAALLAVAARGHAFLVLLFLFQRPIRDPDGVFLADGAWLLIVVRDLLVVPLGLLIAAC